MRWKQCGKVAVTGAALSFAVFVGPATASPIVYSGYDVGSASLATSPNATAAAAAFDLAAGAFSTLDFETPLPAGVTLGGGSIVVASTGCLTATLHCYATSPTHVVFSNGASFGFTTPIDLFGAYFTGWQVSGQTITIGYLGGGTTALSMPAGNLSLGGTLFFGFIDPGSSIISITYTAGSPTCCDATGIDDVRYGNAGTAVPEPTTLVLLGTGLAVALRCRRRPQA